MAAGQRRKSFGCGKILNRKVSTVVCEEFEIYARQMYGDEEVGRVTWRLAPPRKPQ